MAAMQLIDRGMVLSGPRMHGVSERPGSLTWESPRPGIRTTAIVITVHGALAYVESCLDSWGSHTSDSFVYLVDDCDLPEERAALRRIAAMYDNVTVTSTPGNSSVG